VFKRRKPEEPPTPDALPQPMSGPTPLGGPPGARAPDSGVGVPPRPAQPKELPSMSRPPFPAGPAPQAAPPTGQQARPMQQQGRQPAERRTLVVGRGITVNGTIQDAERLVVEGLVEATMIHAIELVVAAGGVFRGEAQVEEAEVAGTVDGTLTARGTLIIRASGRVLGTARCRRLQVEDGGQISGQMEMISDTAPAVPEVPA
jgi:cytoskeletal protein CcmA (bactofilin family)